MNESCYCSVYSGILPKIELDTGSAVSITPHDSYKEKIIFVSMGTYMCFFHHVLDSQ